MIENRRMLVVMRDGSRIPVLAVTDKGGDGFLVLVDARGNMVFTAAQDAWLYVVADQ